MELPPLISTAKFGAAWFEPYVQQTRLIWLAIAVFMVGFVGCQRLPGNQMMRQYQLESDRLLNEFRAQKKRADDLASRNAQLEQRLAESEKMVALSGNGVGRTGRRSIEPELLIGDAANAQRSSNSLSNSGSSRSQGARGISGRTGLPDAETPISGRLTSGGGPPNDPISLGGPPRDLRGDRSRESQWRPVSK